MAIPAAWLHRLRALEETAAAKALRPVREITPDMSVEAIQDAWQLELEMANASTVDMSPAKISDPEELDRLAAEFARSIGAQVEEAETTPESARNVNIRAS